jgi:hypothetical protein
MAAERVAADTCPHCHAEAPARARFCPECGTSLETPTPVDFSLQRVEPKWFGVAAPHALLAAAALALLVAIVLFATDHWPFGLILLGIAALLLAGFMEAARRRPYGRPPAPKSGSDVREVARSRWEEFRARQAAAGEVRRIRSALILVEEDRRRALHDLGHAAHLGDSTGEAAARAALEELDKHEAALKQRLDEQLELAGERIHKARLPVQDTMMVLPSEPSPNPAEPPQPAVVPEPYPPPDEGNPPEPARIPEPTPDQPRRED